MCWSDVSCGAVKAAGLFVDVEVKTDRMSGRNVGNEHLYKSQICWNISLGSVFPSLFGSLGLGMKNIRLGLKKHHSNKLYLYIIFKSNAIQSSLQVIYWIWPNYSSITVLFFNHFGTGNSRSPGQCRCKSPLYCIHHCQTVFTLLTPPCDPLWCHWLHS